MKKIFSAKISKILSTVPNPKFMVSLSGGVDSMVALYLLKWFSDTVTPLHLQAIHVNHNIDSEDDEWEMFCLEKCKELNIPLIRENVFINGYKAIDGVARNDRYKAIGKHTATATFVITGHHANDSAESMLMSLQRGTGLDGLAGIREIRPMHGAKGTLFRPLLAFTKSEIKLFATSNNIKWVEDPSNAKPIYVRNKVRISILPALVKEHGEQVISRISATSEICSNAIEAMEELVNVSLTNNCDWDLTNPTNLPASALLSEKTAPFVLRHWLQLNGVIYLPRKKLLDNMVYQMFTNFKSHHTPVVKLANNITIKRVRNTITFDQ